MVMCESINGISQVKPIFEEILKDLKNLDNIISEYNLQNTQEVINFCDALNEYSVKY